LENAKKFKNRLISVQIALQTRTIIKVPLYNPYDISYVHPLITERLNIYKKRVNLQDVFNFKYKFIEITDPVLSTDKDKKEKKQKKQKIERIKIF
jgi:hypothetical protein